jgi:hypothetical protein
MNSTNRAGARFIISIRSLRCCMGGVSGGGGGGGGGGSGSRNIFS